MDDHLSRPTSTAKPARELMRRFQTLNPEDALGRAHRLKAAQINMDAQINACLRAEGYARAVALQRALEAMEPTDTILDAIEAVKKLRKLSRQNHATMQDAVEAIDEVLPDMVFDVAQIEAWRANVDPWGIRWPRRYKPVQPPEDKPPRKKSRKRLGRPPGVLNKRRPIRYVSEAKRLRRERRAAKLAEAANGV